MLRVLRLPRGEAPFSNENNLRLVHVFRNLTSWKSPSEGMDAARLFKDATLKLLTQENHFRAAVREGIAEADHGEFIEEEDMDAPRRSHVAVLEMRRL